MKKKIIYLLVSLCMCVSVFSACTTTDDSITKGGKISDYIPVKENTMYYYEGDGGISTDWIIFNSYIEDDTHQQRVMFGDYVSSQVLQYKNGELKLLSSFSALGHENYIGYESDNETIILKEPLELNAKWTQIHGDTASVEAEITSIDKEITVPYGTFKAMEVTITNPDGTVYTEYYAKGVGRIKANTVQTNRTKDADGNVISTEHVDITSELVKIEENTPLQSGIAVFQGGADNVNFGVFDITIHTNSNINDIFIDRVREIYNENGDIDISGSTKINSTSIDAAAEEIVVDFNGAFVDDMKNATVGETDAFENIKNTIGYFNFCKYVKITIDGKQYTPDGVIFDENGFSRIAMAESES